MMYARQITFTVCFILFGRVELTDITDHAKQFITEEDAEIDAKWTFV